MRKLMLSSLMLSVAIPVGTAHAQEAAPDEANGGGEIIVTARRREELLSRVPIAISAISSDEITKKSITTETDLQAAVPGLVIRQNGDTFNYVIRGQTVDVFSNSPPSVLPYTNEVQVVTHGSSTFYDMGGIQVLKGPQGTLFGRNTTGGAVLYSTAPATDRLEGYVQGRYGNYDAYNVQGAVNLPISEGSALRVAGSVSGGGGYVRDYFTGDEYGAINQKSIRGTLKLALSPSLTTTTVVQHTDEHGTNKPYLLWSSIPCGKSAEGLVDAASCALNSASNPTFAAFLAAHPQVFQGGLEAAATLQRQLGPWVSMSSYPPFHKARGTYVINTSTFEVSPDVTLKNIFGYNTTFADNGYDFDGSPYHFFEDQGNLTADGVKAIPAAKITDYSGFRLNTRQFSDEFQIQGKALDGRLDYVAGVFYLNQRDGVISNLDFGNFSPIAAPFTFTYTATWKTESIAGFAQATIKATDKLRITGGFRYTRDQITMTQLPGSLWLQFVPSNAPETTKASKPSWNVSVDYQVDPSLMIYATTRGSWRIGGYNYSVFPTNVTAASGGNLFLPETTKDIEVGLKYSGDALGVPATFNADFFNQWINDIQRAAHILTPAGVSLLTTNVPKAQITGFEFDFSVRPSHWVQFGASANYTNARFTNGNVTILGDNLRYGPYADVPKWSGSAFAEIGAPLGSAGELRLRADVYAQSKMYFSNLSATRNPDTILPSYTLVNARLTWAKIMETGLSASLFVRNLFNEKYYTGGNASASGGSTNIVNVGPPRMWGGELRFNF